MKEKIKRISSSTWALLLALMMVVSSFSVLAATTNVNKTSAFNGTVYFKYNDGNSDKYIYTWNSSNKVEGTGVWPGAKMTNLGNGIYSYDFDNTNSCDMVIFNDKGNNGGSFQTLDVTFPTDGRNMYDNTSSESDKWTTYSTSTKVATSVYLSSNATDGKIAQGKDLILSATAIGKVDGDVTYTFYKGNTKVGDAQTTTENTATTTVSGLSAGDYTFTVKVTKDGYTEVASDSINVTVTGGDGYFLYNDNGGKSFKTSTSLGEFSSNVLSLDLDAGKTYYLYIVKNNDVKNSYFSSEKAFDDSNKSVTLYDYGTNNFSDEIVFTPETSGKYKFTWTPGNGQGTLKYELESTPVAKSVNLTANPENVVVGGSTTLTATLDTPNTDNVTYTFTEDGKELQNGSSNTLKLENLTKGTHTYKVTVSADG